MPTLSVGMPVYNGERFLRDALDSILEQSFDDLELLVSDNGSTDATEAICREYETRDPRVRYHRNARNLGATANYNAVCERARGTYFKWASSNDICKPGFFEKCVAVLDERPDVVLCYPKTRLFTTGSDAVEDYDDGLHLVADDPCERFEGVIARLGLNNVMNGLMRTDALRKTRLLPDIFVGDKTLVAHLSLLGKLVELPEPLFYRRMDKESATRSMNAKQVHLHFDPSGGKPMLYQSWKLLFAFFRSVSESDLSRPKKARLYRFLLRQARWSRHDLFGDLVQAARYRWETRSP